MQIQSPTGASDFGGPMKLYWGQSPQSVAEAIQCAVRAAQADLEGSILEWLEVAEIRGGFIEGKELQFQVAVRVGYQLKGEATH